MRQWILSRYYQRSPSDHFDGVRFFNPCQPSTDRGLTAMLRWKLAGGRATWPNSVPVTPAKPEPHVAGLRVTVAGHASLLIQAAGINILTDPVWSERANPVAFAGPERVTAPGIAFEDLAPIDVVLISHCHYDHLDVPTLRRLQAMHATLMAMPLGHYAIVRAAVPHGHCLAGDWWDRLPIGDHISTTLTAAYHWANRWPTDVRIALWAGHFTATPAGSIWFAGDTGYRDGRSSGRCASVSARPTWRGSRSARTSRAGSWPRSTSTRPKPSASSATLKHPTRSESTGEPSS